MFNTVTFARTAVAAFGTVLFAGVCLVGATAPAVAAPIAPAAQVTTIAYGDLNLASGNGRSTLNARINQAARGVCFYGGRDVASQVAYNRCVKTAVAGARAQAYAVTASAN